jgi:tetratricopeptide (TPR) repeat protein
VGYLRARRSIKLGPGVKLNLNKRSMGVTVGGRGAHYTVNTRGQRTTTVGIPGTGASYSSRSSARRPAKARSSSPRTTRRSPPAAPARPTPPAHPGVFARHYERAFYLGTTKIAAGDDKAALAAFRDADTSDDKHRAVSPALFAGVLTFQLGDHPGAVPYLERVTNSAQSLPDKLMSKYAPSLHLGVEVNRISLPVPMGSVAAAMLLAECYCETGRVQEAIGLAQKLHEHSPSWSGMLLFLCSMYLRAEDWDEIVHATAGVSNEDDITLMLRLWQAQAMEKQELPDAALEAYRDALRSKKRDEQLLKEARYQRAKLYIQIGRRAMAKRDLGRLYGEDPEFEDVRVLLASLG